MACSSSAGQTEYWFKLELLGDAVVVSPAGPDRPYVELKITLFTDPPSTTFQRRIFLRSAGDGRVEFDNDSPQVTAGASNAVKVRIYGVTKSSNIKTTKIEARLATTAQTPCETISLTVVEIALNPVKSPFELWYFSDGVPANYPIRAELIVTTQPNLNPSWDWTIVAGATSFSIDVGWVTKDAEMVSIGSSGAVNDCTVKVTSRDSGGVTAKYSFTIDYLLSLASAGPPTDFPYDAGYQSHIPYTVSSRFGTAVTKPLEYNESFANHANYNGSNWLLPNEGTGLLNPASCVDQISSPLLGQPPPQNPQTPLGTVKVDDWQGVWRFGSTTRGRGIVVLQRKWVRYRDHARHE